MAEAELTDLKFVGPATESVLERAGIEPEHISERRVSHAQLVKLGVNPGVAARIRREHSLSWSLSGGEDLDRRAEQVRGLQDGERAWVAASSAGWEDREPSVEEDLGDEDAEEESVDAETAWRNENWPETTVDREEFEAEAEWRMQSSPTPVTAVDGIGEKYAGLLAEGGIRSVRSLATCDPERVARSLDLTEKQVRTWREDARDLE